MELSFSLHHCNPLRQHSLLATTDQETVLDARSDHGAERGKRDREEAEWELEAAARRRRAQAQDGGRKDCRA